MRGLTAIICGVAAAGVLSAPALADYRVPWLRDYTFHLAGDCTVHRQATASARLPAGTRHVTVFVGPGERLFGIRDYAAGGSAFGPIASLSATSLTPRRHPRRLSVTARVLAGYCPRPPARGCEIACVRRWHGVTVKAEAAYRRRVPGPRYLAGVLDSRGRPEPHHRVRVGDRLMVAFRDRGGAGTRYRVCYARSGGAGRHCLHARTGAQGSRSNLFIVAPGAVGRYVFTWRVRGHAVARSRIRIVRGPVGRRPPGS